MAYTSIDLLCSAMSGARNGTEESVLRERLANHLRIMGEHGHCDVAQIAAELAGFAANILTNAVLRGLVTPPKPE